MAAKKNTEDTVEEALAEAAPKKGKPSLAELHDELEALKAAGNPDPDRLAELKRLIAAGG